MQRSRLWTLVQRRARSVLADPDALGQLVRRGEQWTEELAGRRARMAHDVNALLRLIRAYAGGRYRDVSWESMVLAVAAVLYILSPVDLVPDWLPGVGVLDDVTVAGFALRLVRGEIDRFLDWEAHREPAPGAPSGPGDGT